MMSVFMLTMAVEYETLKTREHRWTFAALYGLTFFFANFGPNSTTFVLPAELFPTRVRSVDSHSTLYPLYSNPSTV